MGPGSAANRQTLEKEIDADSTEFERELKEAEKQAI